MDRRRSATKAESRGSSLDICSQRHALLWTRIVRIKKQLEKDKITVHVKYRDIEQTFTGNADDIWVCLNRFFSQMIPALDSVRKITLSVDLDRLLDDLKGIVAVAPEGLELLVSKQKLTDNETLLLNLLATYIGYKIGKLEREWLTKEELQAKLGKSMKITSTRLGELTREGITLKTDEGNYKITTKGVAQLQQELLPKIRTKV